MDMTFYKIVRDGTVIDAGFIFLKWSERSHRLVVCDVNEAQFVQSFDQEHVYHTDWLKLAPTEAGDYETVEVVAVDATEYDEIRALLDDGETIPNEQAPFTEEPEEQSSEPEQPEPERPLTVQEMRQLIADQQERIALLEDCVLEMSEALYGNH